MNVSCTSCSAKYAVPDEKVRGKKVKITCKHCGTGIIVDGTKLGATAEAAKEPAPAPAAAEELRFDIAYPDERQETLGVSEIVAKYAAGTLNDEAFLWREGMADWKAPFDIPELASALQARGLSKRVVTEEDESTRVQSSPFEVPEAPPPGVWREPAKEAQSSPEAAFDLTPRVAAEEVQTSASPKPAAAAPKPAAAVKPAAAAAARRSAARGGGDLFGDLAAAGSEEDESLGSEPKEPAKLTGARNESSVLFSLDALVKQETKPAAKKPAAKQEDAAAFLMGTDSSPSSIANVGTGSFGSAFAAPDFTAPVMAAPEVRASAPVELPTPAAPKKKGMGLVIGIAAVVLLAGGAFALGLPAKLAGTPSAAPATAAPPATPVKAEPTPGPAATPVVPDATAPVPAAAPSAAAPAPATPEAPKPAEATEAAKPVAAAEAAKPAEASKPAEKPAEASKPAEKPTAAPAGDAPPFDKAAAVAALSAAAGNASSCKTPDGPTGGGKVSITFKPSGRATNAQVSGDLAGTSVGGCVARLFSGTKIPAFSGDPVTVSKSFSVQ